MESSGINVRLDVQFLIFFFFSYKSVVKRREDMWFSFSSFLINMHKILHKCISTWVVILVFFCIFWMHLKMYSNSVFQIIQYFLWKLSQLQNFLVEFLKSSLFYRLLRNDWLFLSDCLYVDLLFRHWNQHLLRSASACLYLYLICLLINGQNKAWCSLISSTSLDL